MSLGPRLVTKAAEPIYSIYRKINVARNIGSELKQTVLLGIKNPETFLSSLKVSFDNRYSGFRNFLHLTLFKGNSTTFLSFLNDTRFLMKNVFSKKAQERTSAAIQSLGIPNTVPIVLIGMAESDGKSKIKILEEEVVRLKKELEETEGLAEEFTEILKQMPKDVSEEKLNEATEKLSDIIQKVENLRQQIDEKEAKIKGPTETIDNLNSMLNNLNEQLKVMSNAGDIKDAQKKAVQKKLDSVKKAIDAAAEYNKYHMDEMFEDKVREVKEYLEEAKQMLSPEALKTTPPKGSPLEILEKFGPGDDVLQLGDVPPPDITRPSMSVSVQTRVSGVKKEQPPPIEDLPVEVVLIEPASAPETQGKSIFLSPYYYELLERWMAKWKLKSPEETLQHLLAVMTQVQEELKTFAGWGLTDLDMGLLGAFPMLKEAVSSLRKDFTLINELARKLVGERNREKVGPILEDIIEKFKALQELSGKGTPEEIVAVLTEITEKEKKYKKDILELLKLIQSLDMLKEIPPLAERISQLQKKPDDITIGPIRELILNIPDLLKTKKELSIEAQQIQLLVEFIQNPSNEKFGECKKKIDDPTAKELFEFLVKLIRQHQANLKNIEKLKEEGKTAVAESEKELEALRQTNEKLEKALGLVEEYVQLIKDNPLATEESMPSFEEFVTLKIKGKEVELKHKFGESLK